MDQLSLRTGEQVAAVPMDEQAVRERLARVFTLREVEEACASRDLGAVIRVLNRHGISQGNISVMTGIAQGRLSEYKNGRRMPTAQSTFEAMAEGLRMPDGLRRALGLAGGQETGRKGVPADIAASQGEWLDTRRLLNEHRYDLTQMAIDLYPSDLRLGRTGLLMPPEWRPESPIDLDSIRPTLMEATPPPSVTGKHAETRPILPLHVPGKHYDSYHRTMRDLASPRLFENRVCYRLLDLRQREGGADVALGLMRYFDMIDVGEALAHELAQAAIGGDGNLRSEQPTWDRLPFRRLIPDPLALTAYPLLLSISTLTIRRSAAGSTFVMLRRHAGRVAIAGGMMSVMPTGVFQPASLLPTSEAYDLNVWHNMMREYSEEFLGNPEHDGSGDPIDYERQEPFRALNAARRAGKIRVLCLGAGIDALNMVGDLLTVAIFDADVFDEIFRDLVEVNDEGSVATSGSGRELFAFDESTIRRLLASEPIAPSGAGCLTLAWQNRAAVLGG